MTRVTWTTDKFVNIAMVLDDARSSFLFFSFISNHEVQMCLIAFCHFGSILLLAFIDFPKGEARR